MKCPYCNYGESKVVDSRPSEDNGKIRRRRECLNCSKRFTTYEIIESVPIMVIKKDRTRETFSREKLMKGLLSACYKRPVSLEEIEGIVNGVEAAIQNSLDREIESRRIGELAMGMLKEIDEIAYVRFASVYRQFKDINTFRNELNKLLDD